MRLDPSQIAGLGPSLDALLAMLLERKRKILATYETESVQRHGPQGVSEGRAARSSRRRSCASGSSEAVRRRAAPRPGDAVVCAPATSARKFARQLVQLVEQLGDKYQVDELAAKYEFTGRTPLTIPEALGDQGGAGEDRRAAQAARRGARRTPRSASSTWKLLEQFAEPGDMEKLDELQQQIENYVREMAERQGLEQRRQGLSA